MDQNKCFICGSDCSQTHNYLINLSTKKYKTEFTSLISELIEAEYEIRVTDENKICERCSVLIEKFDEVQQETRILKSVLGRQIARNYNIRTSETMIYMDTTKIFTAIPQQGTKVVKYSCRYCPGLVTECIDAVNTHIMYHRLLKQEQTQPEVSKEIQGIQSLRRETQKRAEPERLAAKQVKKFARREETKFNHNIELPQIKQEVVSNLNIQIQEYDEETLDSLIDLETLGDPSHDSNLKSSKCTYSSCSMEFKYVCDYVRHLKLKHKSTPSLIFEVVRSNITKPKKVHKLMCPYCFTKTADSSRLAEHVRKHEESAHSNLFAERTNEFANNVMSASRCTICDCEIRDTSVLECNHEIVKNGIAQMINCVYCTRGFYSEKLYHNHLALDHSQCFICSSTCDDKVMLADHIRSHLCHAEYSCAFCIDIYQTKKDRLEHMKATHPEQCCMFCEEWFVEKDELTQHIRWSHADKRLEEMSSICDTCGGSFKNKELCLRHQQQEHKKRTLYTCTACGQTFRFRYLLMDHMTTIHKRTIFDPETNFYKCFLCSEGFSSQNRKTFVQHLHSHNKSSSFCSDCNVHLESVLQLEAHRERSHQDFSFLVAKAGQPTKVPAKPKFKVLDKKEATNRSRIQRSRVAHHQQSQEQYEETIVQDEFPIVDDERSAENQLIMVKTEDGNLLNMNNFILTENGELIIQDLEELWPKSQEGGVENSSDGQLQFSNLEEFLIEQGIPEGTEISYVEQPDESQVIIKLEDGTVSQNSQDSLMQTYKEIFEPDDEIPSELIQSSAVQDGSSSQNVLLNGQSDYIVQAFNSDQVIEQVEIPNCVQIDANQSTLDELGDILLEVAAAAEKEKKPKAQQSKVRETLWGKRKLVEEPITNNGAAKKRGGGKDNSFANIKETTDAPASNFSQAYEFFVKGFDAKKQKNL